MAPVVAAMPRWAVGCGGGGVAHSATFQLHKQCRSEIARGDSFCAARSREPNRLQFFPRDAGKTGFLFYFSGWEIPIIKKSPRARAKNQPKNGFLDGSGARPLCIKLFGVHACPAGPTSCPAGENFANQGPLFDKILKETLHSGRHPGRLKPGFWGTFF